MDWEAESGHCGGPHDAFGQFCHQNAFRIEPFQVALAARAVQCKALCSQHAHCIPVVTSCGEAHPSEAAPPSDIWWSPHSIQGSSGFFLPDYKYKCSPSIAAPRPPLEIAVFLSLLNMNVNTAHEPPPTVAITGRHDAIEFRVQLECPPLHVKSTNVGSGGS